MYICLLDALAAFDTCYSQSPRPLVVGPEARHLPVVILALVATLFDLLST